MNTHTEPALWTCASSIVSIDSPWVRMLAERWIDDQGRPLDYWRVERAHSVIVIPLWRRQVLLPQPQFRPGVQGLTLDLPGGRLPAAMTPAQAGPLLLQKELGIDPTSINTIEILNAQGWIINSSFSNQLLYGLLATLNDSASIDMSRVHRSVAHNFSAIAAFTQELECLQCRSVLQTWLLSGMTQ